MRDFAQIIDAHEVFAGDLISTWYDLWSIEKNKFYSIQVAGTAPLDIGHIVFFNSEAEGDQACLSVLAFEFLKEDWNLMVDPVSFDPSHTRPFQNLDWKNAVKYADKSYSKRVAAFRNSDAVPVVGGRLYTWCNHDAVLEELL